MIKFIALILMLSACTKFEAGKPNVDPSLFSAGDTSLNPSTDKLVSDCFGRAEFDGCLF